MVTALPLRSQISALLLSPAGLVERLGAGWNDEQEAVGDVQDHGGTAPAASTPSSRLRSGWATRINAGHVIGHPFPAPSLASFDRASTQHPVRSTIPPTILRFLPPPPPSANGGTEVGFSRRSRGLSAGAQGPADPNCSRTSRLL